MHFRGALCLSLIGCAQAGGNPIDAAIADVRPAVIDSSPLPDVIIVDAPPPDSPPPDSSPPDVALPPDASIPTGCSATAVGQQMINPVLSGCAGTVAWTNRATLCGAGRVPCPAAWWISLRNGGAPSHNYWVNENLTWSGSGPNACAALTSGGSTCPAGDPMRVCSAGTDSEGNVCTWTGCGFGANTPNQYFGGCQNATAGTLCVVSPCADGSAEDVFAGGMFGCGGHVAYAARAQLCGAGYHVCTADEWVARHGAQNPTHDYWTNDDLKFSGTGSNMCSVSTTAGTACVAGVPMRVCSGATDPDNNTCTWTDCGYGTQSPDQHFGGCSNDTTAGALCCGI